jgi:hypothetical protein
VNTPIKQGFKNCFDLMPSVIKRTIPFPTLLLANPRFEIERGKVCLKSP